MRKCVLWVGSPVSDAALAEVLLAAEVAECPLVVCGLKGALADSLVQAAGVVEFTSDVDVGALLVAGDVERLRALGQCSVELRRLAHQTNVAIFEDPVGSFPRFELLAFLREQAVSVRYHRYGHLGLRELESANLGHEKKSVG